MAYDEEALLREMVDLIVREVEPEAIILFGSRARGDARPDSDFGRWKNCRFPLHRVSSGSP